MSRDRDLNKVIVIDVESTCWEPKNSKPNNEESEIIEVGVAIVDLAKRAVVDSDALIIRPQFSKVSGFCTQLTTLTQEQVDKGLTFFQACDILKKKYGSLNSTWVSWGDYDRVQFERNCGLYNCKYPFGRTHLNLKNFFSLAHGLKKEIGLDAAVQYLKLPFEGTHHRGIDDAKNIANVFLKTFPNFKS